MQVSAPLSDKGYSLVLDIYLGGVSGAIVRNNNIHHATHHKTAIPEENTVINLLQKTDFLLQKTLDDLVPKQTIIKTYVFIDAPLSHTESAELIFQKDDKTFCDKTPKEIRGALDLPQSYKVLLGSHSSDGVVIEHPPTHHIIHGYKTSNFTLQGERKARVAQQWIERGVYRAIQEAKKTYALGEIVFLNTSTHTEKNGSLFLLGDVISRCIIKNKNILIGMGTRVALAQCRDMHSQSIFHIESVLKSVARDHGVKDVLYKTILNYFNQSISKALRQEGFIDDTRYSCAYVGDIHMFPVVEDAFSSFKNINVIQKYTDANARLSYIIKNKVQ
jgi:hypothetical protein